MLGLSLSSSISVLDICLFWLGIRQLCLASSVRPACHHLVISANSPLPSYHRTTQHGQFCRMTICYGQPEGELGGAERTAGMVAGGFHFHTHAPPLPPLCQALAIQNSGYLAAAVVFEPLGRGSSGLSGWSGAASSSQTHPIFTPSAIAATAPVPSSWGVWHGGGSNRVCVKMR